MKTESSLTASLPVELVTAEFKELTTTLATIEREALDDASSDSDSIGAPGDTGPRDRAEKAKEAFAKFGASVYETLKTLEEFKHE